MAGVDSTWLLRLEAMSRMPAIKRKMLPRACGSHPANPAKAPIMAIMPTIVNAGFAVELFDIRTPLKYITITFSKMILPIR